MRDVKPKLETSEPLGISKVRLSRRDFLRGAIVAGVALPGLLSGATRGATLAKQVDPKTFAGLLGGWLNHTAGSESPWTRAAYLSMLMQSQAFRLYPAPFANAIQSLASRGDIGSGGVGPCGESSQRVYVAAIANYLVNQVWAPQALKAGVSAAAVRTAQVATNAQLMSVPRYATVSDQVGLGYLEKLKAPSAQLIGSVKAPRFIQAFGMATALARREKHAVALKSFYLPGLVSKAAEVASARDAKCTRSPVAIALRREMAADVYQEYVTQATALVAQLKNDARAAVEAMACDIADGKLDAASAWGNCCTRWTSVSGVRMPAKSSLLPVDVERIKRGRHAHHSQTCGCQNQGAAPGHRRHTKRHSKRHHGHCKT